MIPIEFIPDSLEHCAIQGPGCRVFTSHWTALPDREPGEQVAVCRTCSESHKPEDVPSKKDWWDRHWRPRRQF